MSLQYEGRAYISYLSLPSPEHIFLPILTGHGRRARASLQRCSIRRGQGGRCRGSGGGGADGAVPYRGGRGVRREGGGGGPGGLGRGGREGADPNILYVKYT